MLHIYMAKLRRKLGEGIRIEISVPVKAWQKSRFLSVEGCQWYVLIWIKSFGNARYIYCTSLSEAISASATQS